VSHHTSQGIFAWTNVHWATTAVLVINAWSVRALVCSVKLVPLCVLSAIHRLGFRTLVWRLYSVIALARRVPILINSKAFVWCVSLLASPAHLRLPVYLVTVQTKTTITSIFLDLKTSATRHVRIFQCRARARFVLSVRRPALLALNCQISALIVHRDCTCTSSSVSKSVLSDSTVMKVCRNARTLPN